MSRTTASFVTTGREDMGISEEARYRVLRAARELNYRPNLMARSLRTKVTSTIALVSDTIATEQYAGQAVYGALAAAAAHRHLLFIAETEGDPAVEGQLVENLVDRQVDGFVYAAMWTREVHVPRVLRGHPLVLLNCTAKGWKVPAVLPDEVVAGRTAAEALLDAGHRDGIWVLGEPAPHTFAGRERIDGIEKALAAAGTRLAGTLECGWWPIGAHEALARFLDGGGRPRALICLNDRIAMGAYQALQEHGVRVPAEVSVVSFDDSDLATWLRPQLSSVAIPHYELGRRAVELLLDGESPNRVERVAMPLVPRASVGPPAGT